MASPSPSSLRFVSARQVFDAFPTAGDDIAAAPDDTPPLAFLAALAGSPTPEDAIAFAAYLLPRREAVWWACQGLRSMGAAAGPEETALSLAEGWVRQPEENRRRVALDYAMNAQKKTAAIWTCFAAGFSGGSIAPPERDAVPPAPELTARAARAAVLLGLAGVSATDRAAWIAHCADAAARLAARPAS